MAIEIKTIDIILAIASIAIFIIVFFLVFKFRKKKKATQDHGKIVEESVVAMPVKMIRENIRDAAPEKIEMPETADLKLEDSLPEPAGSNKPEITETPVHEIQDLFSNEFMEKPDDFKLSEHENITDENVELKLEDELPEKSTGVKISEQKIEISDPSAYKFEEPFPEKASDIDDPVLKTEIHDNNDLELEDPLPEKLSDSQTAQIADTGDALTGNSGVSIVEDGHVIEIPKTTKPNKKSVSTKKRVVPYKS